LKANVKVWIFAIALLTPADQQRFTITEEAADWYEIVVQQRIAQPPTADANGQLHTACRHTTFLPSQPF